MTARDRTSPTRAQDGEEQTRSVPAAPDHGESSASTLVESPQPRKRNPLDNHSFPDGGGSGGAEAFSRKRLKR